MFDVIPIVYVVDDDISVREGLEGLIHKTGWRASVFSSAEEFLSHSRPVCPCCLILDIMLPGLSGLDLQQRMAAEGTKMPVIFISGYSDVPNTVCAMKAGAVEFLIKPFNEKLLLEAVRSALDLSRDAYGAESEIMGLLERYASLSARERQVMALVVSGLMNKQVGGKLGISEITVKAHRGRVMQKMKASSLADLVNIAAVLDNSQQESRRLKLTSMATLKGDLAYPLITHCSSAGEPQVKFVHCKQASILPIGGLMTGEMLAR